MPEFRSLEIFYWVARLGSFRRASERLHTTQPAISQRIAGLEAELGVRLFDRTSRSVALTGKGRELLDYAERMLRLRTEMIEALGRPAGHSGVLRVGVAETVVHIWLSAFIERAHALFPNVTLDIAVDTSPNLREALVENSVDIAFLLGPVSLPEMANTPIGSYALRVVARPDYPIPEEPLTAAGLSALPIITYPKTTRPYIELRELLAAAGRATPRLYSNASLSTIIRMTLDGIGVSVIPAEVIEHELGEKRLRLVDAMPLPTLVFTATFRRSPESALPEAIAALAASVAGSKSISNAY